MLHDLDSITFFRGLVLVCSGIVVLVLGYRLLKTWPFITAGQRLFALGSLLVVLGTCVSLAQGIYNHRPFSWGIPLYFCGIMCFYLYMLEPMRSQKTRWGHEIFTSKDKI